MITKIPLKKLIEFRRKSSEKGQANFAKRSQIPKQPKLDDGSGGNYWTRSSSGLSNAFKYNDNTLIEQKINEITKAYQTNKNRRTQIMYERNLEILHNFQGYDFSALRPRGDLIFHSKPKTPLMINNLPLQVIPNHVFSFANNETVSIGGVWFVTWLDGFNSDDLKIYSEALFRYLSDNYPDHIVDNNYCLIMDVLSKDVLKYVPNPVSNKPSLLYTTAENFYKYL